MPRGISIHIGVNRPASNGQCTLSQSEWNAWRMAELAQQAGYGAIQVLRGASATRAAVLGVLSHAARALQPRDTLLVTFSGHGMRVLDRNGDERDRWDETWCLSDRDLVDDELLEIWRLAAEGTRVLVVSESCFGGGVGRDGDEVMACYSAPAATVYRSAGPTMRGVKQYAQQPSSCIATVPEHNDGIRATVLVMSASAEAQKAREGLYTHHLLALWDGGKFRDSLCELHRQVGEKVTDENPEQHPQIVMLGTPNERFPLERAFHLNGPVMRGGWG